MKAPRPVFQSTISRGSLPARLTILCQAGTIVLPQFSHNGTHRSADSGVWVVQGIAGFDQTLDGAPRPFLVGEYGSAKALIWLT
jgi:hypothetical protein